MIKIIDTRGVKPEQSRRRLLRWFTGNPNRKKAFLIADKGSMEVRRDWVLDGRIIAPFTAAQVRALNNYQQSPTYHPFTCCSPEEIATCLRAKSGEDRYKGLDVEYNDRNEGVLIATKEGWVCPCGVYKQGWAHDYMAGEKVR